jgi:hypothetical protein
MIDQNPAQLLRCYGIEVSSILPIDRFGPANPKVGFVHHRRRLQGVLAVLAAHFAGGNPMQFSIDQVHQLTRGFWVAAPLPVEQAGNRVRIAIFLHIPYS